MKKIITFALIAILTIFLLLGYSTSVNSNLSQNIVRLHVIANSDTENDQLLKLKVRDAILSESRNGCTKKGQVNRKLSIYKEIAENIISENGYNYPVEVEYGNFKFPTKKYNNIVFPAGNYDAVRVKIGKAEGKNWWCVMFPPLCFVDGTTDTAYAESKLRESISKESYGIITSNNEDTTLPFSVKFKIVELCGRFIGKDKVYAKADK